MERQDQLRFRSYRLIFRIRAAFVSDKNQRSSWGTPAGGESATARPAGVFATALEHATCHADARNYMEFIVAKVGNDSPIWGIIPQQSLCSAAPRPTFSKTKGSRSYRREKSPVGSLIVKVVSLPSSD